MAAPQRASAPGLAWSARELVPGLRARPAPGGRPDRRSRRAARSRRRTARLRQPRRALSIVRNSTKGARPSPSVARGRAGAIVGTPLAADRWGSPLARSVAPDRASVRVNATRAGVTVTPALLKIPEAQTMIDITMKRNPTGRMTTPQDVANAIPRALRRGHRLHQRRHHQRRRRRVHHRLVALR
jgi:Enoyl-(Acyl carrier protein) reductase